MNTRAHFDNELANLRNRLSELGAMVVSALEQAIQSLRERDVELARAVMAGDALINAAHQQIEQSAVNLIAMQQPVARDLRRIIATLNVGAELERIADYAKGVAKMLIGAPEGPVLEAPDELIELGEQAVMVLRRTLYAFTVSDVDAATGTADAEEQVDRLYRSFSAGIAAQITPPRAADLIFTAHYFERVADRATNVAEKIVYTVKGGNVELNP